MRNAVRETTHLYSLPKASSLVIVLVIFLILVIIMFSFVTQLERLGPHGKAHGGALFILKLELNKRGLCEQI